MSGMCREIFYLYICVTDLQVIKVNKILNLVKEYQINSKQKAILYSATGIMVALIAGLIIKQFRKSY